MYTFKKLSATNLFQPFHGLDFVEEKLRLFDGGDSGSRHQGTSCLLYMVQLLLLAQHGGFWILQPMEYGQSPGLNPFLPITVEHLPYLLQAIEIFLEYLVQAISDRTLDTL
jgi:hypothetical protein